MTFKVYQGEPTDNATRDCHVASFDYVAVGEQLLREFGWDENAVEVRLGSNEHGGLSAIVHDLRWNSSSISNFFLLDSTHPP